MAGEMTKEQLAKANAWVEKHRPRCPLCGRTELVVSNKLCGLATWELGPGGNRAILDNAMPAIAAVCRGCGHVDLFIAQGAGIE